MIRVHVVAASAVARAGLEALLQEHPEIETVTNTAEADVIVRDGLQEPAGDGPSIPVVVLTDAASMPDAFRSGARAVLQRSASPAQIIAAVYAAAAGLVAVAAEDRAAVLPQAPAEHTTETLTPRETEVLEMLAEGLSNKEIAYRLGISEHTAKFHVNSILTKLNAGTRTEAVMRGIRLGLVMI